MAKEKKAGAAVKSLADFDEKYANRRVDVAVMGRDLGVWPTGSPTLDDTLAGGLPKGKMVEIGGPPGGGKTTVALNIIANALREGVTCVYMDQERGLDLRDETLDADEGALADAVLDAEMTAGRTEKRQSWLRTNGIDPFDPNFKIFEPYSGEELFTMLGEIVQHKLAGIVVVDSVPAILPQKVLDGQPGEASYGARAKLLSEELPRLLRFYGDNLETTIIFINQVRENIGAQVKSYKSTGGLALEHYMRAKIRVQRMRRFEQGGDIVTETRVKVEKNIYGANRECMIRISSKRGLDTLAELLAAAVDFRYIQKSGNWHYFFEAPVDDAVFKTAQAKKTIAELPGYLAGVNGEGAALDWMTAHGWKDLIYPLVQKLAR